MIENFSIRISNLAWGNEDIEMFFDEERLYFSAGYLSSDPLGDMVKIAAYFINDEDSDHYVVKWDGEPVIMEFEVQRDLNCKDVLRISAKTVGEYEGDEEYHFEVTLQAFKSAVIKEAIRVLKEYGIRGYDGSWCDGWDTFPLTSLLVLLGSTSKFDEDTDSYRSNLKEEISLLLQAIG